MEATLVIFSLTTFPLLTASHHPVSSLRNRSRIARSAKNFTAQFKVGLCLTHLLYASTHEIFDAHYDLPDLFGRA